MTPVAPTPALARLRASFPTPAGVRVLLHRGTCGDAAGADRLRAALTPMLDDVLLVDAACDGVCWAAPAATVVRPAHRHRFAHLDMDVEARVALVACAGGDCDHPYAGSGEAGLTRRLGRTDGSLADALAQGAYAALAFALTLPPRTVVDVARMVGESAGGGPLAALAPSWADVAALPQAPPLLAFYAALDEAGRLIERHLIEGDPHRVIEGVLIAARATGVPAVALSVEGRRSFDALGRAVEAARAAGVVDGDALGGRTAAVHVLETAPDDDDGGIRARRFEAAVAATLIFDAPPPPTALLAVSGRVPRPGLYEVPVDGSTQWAGVLAMAGASPAGVAALRLGPSGARLVTRDDLDRPVRWTDVEAGSAVALGEDEATGGHG